MQVACARLCAPTSSLRVSPHHHLTVAPSALSAPPLRDAAHGDVVPPLHKRKLRRKNRLDIERAHARDVETVIEEQLRRARTALQGTAVAGALLRADASAGAGATGAEGAQLR